MGAALGSAKPEDCTSWLAFSTDCPGCASASVNQTTFIKELGSPFVYSENDFVTDFRGPEMMQFPIGLTALWKRNQGSYYYDNSWDSGNCDVGINVTDPWPPILQCPRDLEVSRVGGSVDFNGTAGVLFTPPGDEVLVTLQRPTVRARCRRRTRALAAHARASPTGDRRRRPSGGADAHARAVRAVAVPCGAGVVADRRLAHQPVLADHGVCARGERGVDVPSILEPIVVHARD